MKPLMTPRLGQVQAHLQNGRLWRFVNALSSLRYWLWRFSGGTHAKMWSGPTITVHLDSSTASTNLHSGPDDSPSREATQ